MTRRELADELGQAEADMQAAQRYHDRERSELSRQVLLEARQRHDLVQRMFSRWQRLEVVRARFEQQLAKQALLREQPHLELVQALLSGRRRLELLQAQVEQALASHDLGEPKNLG